MRPPREDEQRRERARRAYAIFSELFELSAQDRRGRLEALEPDLRLEVEALLKADLEATGLIDGQAADVAIAHHGDFCLLQSRHNDETIFAIDRRLHLNI